ncbi:MAG TPA: class I tRNA ligase family protein [Candidatus Paceibacterota bacterium]|nr:class I tRNA ligase family protein [Candidatus Paceibacterota bacterium]
MSDTKPVKSAVAQAEERVLDFWRTGEFFKKTLEKDAPNGEYVFYDGPPFATGTPHFGHILASTIKDMVPRYKTMRGYRVERKWGWDCHGLPIENIVEKDLKIAGRKEIEKYGIAKFNEHARSKVLGYVHDWKETVERIGRWVDFDGSYKTMDNSYIESVWWALKELNEKQNVYEGTRVLPYCPRCETPIANSEIAMDNSYRDIRDISVYVLFELTDRPGVHVLAWTTTPWTLPGNFALAINPELSYVEAVVSKEGKTHTIILAKDRVEEVLVKRGYEISIQKEFPGTELLGLSYKPLFNYFVGHPALEDTKYKAWKIYPATFVEAGSGTGVVHISPGYGEDDMDLAKKEGIPWRHHVTSEGKFSDEIEDLMGRHVKPKPEKPGDHQVMDIEIIKKLAGAGTLFAKEVIAHSYPHCYRCDTPLFYFAIPAWFINIQKSKSRILELNENIHWVPDHLKLGRFGKSAEGAPDWNISRNRFWASPLPIWKSEKTGKFEVIGTLAELKAKVDKKNRFFVMRHGQAENNAKGILSADLHAPYPLTELGKEQVVSAVPELKKLGIKHIYSSDILRTKETALQVAKALGLSEESVVFDPRLREVSFGELEGKDVHLYHKLHETYTAAFAEKMPGGESLTDVRQRIGEFLYETYAKHENDTVLVVGHESPLWIMESVAGGLDVPAAAALRASKQGDYMKNAECRELNFIPIPHNECYELDLHRPYIDEIVFSDGNGGVMRRIPEVIDCWFESGSMPFASQHFPMENKDVFAQRFPAQFVAEYLAQTRTWFYYMHVLGTMLFDKAPFEHVVTTGNVLAEDGQKMSKSKNNFPDPALTFDKYGVDALRYYLLSSPLMRSEDMNFAEKDLDTIYKKIVLRLENVLSFYSMYAKDKVKDGELNTRNLGVLDMWIIERLNETLETFTTHMEMYALDDALRPLEGFVDDLSTWFVRRSRDRLKNEDEDAVVAASVLRHVLHVFSRTIAPSMPFIAERIFAVVKTESDPESVHLASWPEIQELTNTEKEARTVRMEIMTSVRTIVSAVLDERMKANIKVRQPLTKISCSNHVFSHVNPDVQEEYKHLISEETNVKEVVFTEGESDTVSLDTTLTPELIVEGSYRDLVRLIQDKRKEAGLQPGDKITVSLPDTEAMEQILGTWKDELANTVSASKIELSKEHTEATIHVV